MAANSGNTPPPQADIEGDPTNQTPTQRQSNNYEISQECQPQITEAEKFLCVHFSSIRKLLGNNVEFIEFRYFRPNTRTAPPIYSSFAGLRAALQKVFRLNAQGYDVYYGANPRPGKGRGKKDDIELLISVWCDLDAAGSGRKPANPARYATIEDIMKALNRFPIAPSVMINSGAGIQCHWYLDEPVPCDGGRDGPGLLAEQVMKEIAAQLKGDNVSDISRILRLPGTVNHKHTPKATSHCMTNLEGELNTYYLKDFDIPIPTRPPTQEEPTLTIPQPSRFAGLIPVGQRHRELLRAANTWAREGYGLEGILKQLILMNQLCTIKKQRWELEKIALDSFNHVGVEGTRTYLPVDPDNEPGVAAEIINVPDVLPGLHLTDLGNGQRFARQHKGNTRYCHERGRWFHFNGARWVLDKLGETKRKAKLTVGEMYREIRPGMDEERRKAIAKHAARSEGDQKIKAMLSMAESEPDIPILEKDFDGNTWLLNVANGTLDLRTQELRDHRANDYCTKLAPVIFDPQATCPQWDTFLNEIMDGNTDLISFLQRAIGYSLTGNTKEQCFFLFYGAGANGKSTLLQCIANLLGDYWQRSQSEMLLLGQFGRGIPNDIARLKGVRFCSVVEVEQGRKLAESLVKSLTGGDTVTARFLRAEFFEFMPEFKMFIGSNPKPVIKGTDLAIWRRIRLVPFTVSIAPERQDKELGEKLKEEMSGILNWALAGCRAWQEDGLGAPQEVESATSEYQQESDILGQFLEECTFEEAGSVTSGTALWMEYKQWAEANGERLVTSRVFKAAIQEKGFERVRRNTGYHYRNITLRSSTG